MMKFHSYLFLFMFSLISISTSGQFNLKIAYELNHVSSSQNTLLTNAFNFQNEETLSVGNTLPRLRYMNGLNLGISYRTPFSRVEIAWHTLVRRREAFGETVDPVTSFDVSMRYNIRGFQLMYELIYKQVAIGATVGRDNFIMTTDIVSSSNDKEVTRQELYNTSIHLSLMLMESNRMSMVLRPYVTFYYQDVNHADIYDFLNVDRSGITTTDRPMNVGISLIFYNGRQSN